MVKVHADSVAEGHCLHLKALVRQERGVDYQRQDYLSHEWQRSLLRPRDENEEDAVKTERESPSAAPQMNDDAAKKSQQRESPTSTALSSSLFDFDTSVESSLELCIQWRAKIIE
jgi:hypothetical protein